MQRRVVVTGMGLASSLGGTAAVSWDALLKGRSGITRIDKDPLFSGADFKRLPRYAARINTKEAFLEKQRTSKLLNESTLFLPLALAKSEEALADSGIVPESLSEEEKDRFGVIIGTALSKACDIERFVTKATKSGYSSIQKMAIFHTLPNGAASLIALKYHLRAYSITPAVACSAGLQAIGEGYRSIKNDFADCMLVGGVEHSVYPFIIQSMAALNALSTGYEDEVDKASRPFDEKRNGCVMGDGAGILVLEVRSSHNPVLGVRKGSEERCSHLLRNKRIRSCK